MMQVDQEALDALLEDIESQQDENRNVPLLAAKLAVINAYYDPILSHLDAEVEKWGRRAGFMRKFVAGVLALFAIGYLVGGVAALSVGEVGTGLACLALSIVWALLFVVGVRSLHRGRESRPPILAAHTTGFKAIPAELDNLKGVTHAQHTLKEPPR